MYNTQADLPEECSVFGLSYTVQEGDNGLRV